MGRFRLRGRNQTTIPTPILESESESIQTPEVVVNIVYYVVHIVCEVDVIANSLVLYLPFCSTLNKNFFSSLLRWSRNRSQNCGDWNRSQNLGDWNRSRNRGDWNRSQNRGDWNRSQNRGDWNRSRNRGDWNRIRITIPIPHMYVQ